MSTPFYQHGNFAETIGYRLTAWREHAAEISLEVDAAHGFAGCYQAPPGQGRRAPTLSLTTQYLRPIADGTRLTATATRSGGGRTIFFSSCEVRDTEGRLVATGSGTFEYRS